MGGLWGRRPSSVGGVLAEIVLDDVWKVYPDGTVAVQSLDLEIDDKEFMVLVGPSGCGKTTALRMIAGLESVSEGTVRIGDRVVNDVPPKQRDIAMVFQNYALYPHMSVFENMAFGLKLQKVPKHEINSRVQEAARILGLDELLNRKPAALSGGQRQRVAMGRAIVRHPQAFLMDEPLSNLDAKLRVQMRSEIARIQSDLGVTTIYVTHDQTEAMTMGDRVAVIRKGQLQQVDEPQALYEHPKNLFVAGFIGSPAMNLFEATLRIDDGRGGSRVRRVPPRGAPRSARRRGRRCARTQTARSRSASVPRTWKMRRWCPTLRPTDASPSLVELVEALGSDVVVHFTIARRCRAHRRRQRACRRHRDPDRRRHRGQPHQHGGPAEPAHRAREGRAHRTGGRHPSAALLRPRGQLSHLRQDS